jgi:hypothetical protein
MRTGIEAAEYGAELQRIVRYLGVSNGNMQEGSLRCDVNVSVRPVGQSEFGTKVILLSLGVLITVCYSVCVCVCVCVGNFCSQYYDLMIHWLTNLIRTK